MLIFLVAWTVACLAAAVWAVRRWTPPLFRPVRYQTPIDSVEMGPYRTAGVPAVLCEACRRPTCATPYAEVREFGGARWR